MSGNFYCVGCKSWIQKQYKMIYICCDNCDNCDDGTFEYLCDLDCYEILKLSRKDFCENCNSKLKLKLEN